jgi:undecaprenyl pyrophosphate phosphatase UppP
MYFSIASMFLIGGLTQVHSSPVSHYHNHTVCEFSNEKFAVHARTTVTFAGVTSTVYGGDVGVYPGTSITGSKKFVNSGEVKTGSDVFANHVVDAHVEVMEEVGDFMAIEIGNMIFEPGTHRSGSAINFAHGTVVTLDGKDQVNPQFTFIAGTTLITAADTTFNLIRGAKAENVLWVLGTAATLGARSEVAGSIMAGTAITFGTNSKLYGCALAQTAVTFESGGSVVLHQVITDAPSSAPSVTPIATPSAAPTTTLSVNPTLSSAPSSQFVSGEICEDFAVNARTAVTFATNNMVHNGNVGVYPGTAITGNPRFEQGAKVEDDRSELQNFANHVVDEHADRMQQQEDKTIPIEIGNQIFEPGTYRSATAFNIASGTVTLHGNSTAKFTFIAGTALTTAADTKIILTGGVEAENVLWVLGTAATLGARSEVTGSIMAGTAITFGINSKLYGCALAQTAVTFASGSVVVHNQVDTGAPSSAPSRTPIATPSAAPSLAPTGNPTTSSAPSFGSVSGEMCSDFAVHARTTITFAGVTSIVYDGDIGVYPGTSITGSYLTPTGGVVTDSDFADHVVGKHASAMAAYPQVANMAIEIGNMKFEPGTHRSGSAINFAHGTVVTLDGAGEYTFIAGTTLITAADTTFILKNGAKAENVLWVLGTAATLGARSIVPGSIMAGTAITFGTNSKLYGCALAQSAVTFESGGSVLVDQVYGTLP